MNEEKMDELLRLMRAVVPDTSDMSDAGRVGFVYRQNYDPAVQYEELDVVKFGMSLWTPKTATIGNSPPDQSQEGQEDVEENDFWVMFLPGALGSDYVKKTDLSKPPTETATGVPGVNFPDGKTIQIDENGMLTGTPLDFMGTWKSLQEGIASGEIKDGMIGYIRGDSENEEDSDHPNSFLFPVDDFLSLISSNAVQNRIVTAALERLEQLENETRALRASLESFGLSKICPLDLTDVTEDNGMVLGAFEKNPLVEGSIASLLNKLEKSVQDLLLKNVGFTTMGRVEKQVSDNVAEHLGRTEPWQTTCYNLWYTSNEGESVFVIGIDQVNETGILNSSTQISLSAWKMFRIRTFEAGTWSEPKNILTS